MDKALPLLPDTNVLLRYLLDDEPSQSSRAREFWETIRDGSSRAVLTEGVLMECVYVLQRFYKVPRDRIATSLAAVLAYKGLSREDVSLFDRALEIYSAVNLDFVDCLLAARQEAGAWEVLSFDQGLNGYLKRRAKPQ